MMNLGVKEVTETRESLVMVNTKAVLRRVSACAKEIFRETLFMCKKAGR